MADELRQDQITCAMHGPAHKTYICEHLAANPVQTWFSTAPSPDKQWPDAWCAVCHKMYRRENQWNEKNEGALSIKLFCHRCYESHRAQGTPVDVPDYEIPD
jgi:hypothetical protein